MPTRERIENWFVLFEKRNKLNFGFAPSTFAKKLLGLNFAEIEDFGITILRKYVLNQPDLDLKSIVNKEFTNLQSRNVKVESIDKE
jgi:hypothetical protein